MASGLKKDGHWDQAIKLYQDAITIESDNPKLYFELAECYGREDDLLRAVMTMNKAIVIDSSYAGFYNNRGMYYYHLFADDKATVDIEKAVQLDNKNPIYYLNFSLVYYSANRFDEACNAFQAAKAFGLDTNTVRNQKDFVKLQSFCKTNYGVNL
jgi:tetratricopeptide (TPR) repeat protein